MLQLRSICAAAALGALLFTASDATAHDGYARSRQQQPQRLTSEPREAQEPPEFRLGTAGVCQLHQLSGYLALAADGQMLPLTEYCQQQRNWVWYEASDFWKEFRQVASVETLTFTQTLNRERVEAYAGSICTCLDDGTTLQELQKIQADDQLPADFERAVTIAAVKAYCRQHRAALAASR
jgi:hypothetical protein